MFDSYRFVFQYPIHSLASKCTIQSGPSSPIREMGQDNYFSFFSKHMLLELIVVLGVMISVYTHNISFYGKIRSLSPVNQNLTKLLANMRLKFLS